jgi:hypothetical protein
MNKPRSLSRGVPRALQPFASPLGLAAGGRGRSLGAGRGVRRRASHPDSALAGLGQSGASEAGAVDGASSMTRAIRAGEFRRHRAGDQGRRVPSPLDPSTLFPVADVNRTRSLSQNQPPRFHLNCEPRHVQPRLSPSVRFPIPESLIILSNSSRTRILRYTLTSSL